MPSFSFKKIIGSILTFKISELQAFMMGIVIALVAFAGYTGFFTSCPSFLLSEDLKGEEQELQQMIVQTDSLLKDLAVTIEKNKAALDKMASVEKKKEAPAPREESDTPSLD